MSQTFSGRGVWLRNPEGGSPQNWTRATFGPTKPKSQIRKPLEATNTFETCIAANPNNSDAYLFYGNYLEQKSNKLKEAEAQYKKAIEKNNQSTAIVYSADRT